MLGEITKCEVEDCTEDATMAVRDVLEKFPMHGNCWVEREPLGPVHYRCNDHRRESITFRGNVDGRI